MKNLVAFNIIIIILLQVSRISNAGIPDRILMQRMRAGFQGAGGPVRGGGFLGGPIPDGGEGLSGSSPGSMMGPNRGGGLLDSLRRGMNTGFGASGPVRHLPEMFSFGGGGLGDSLLSPGGPPFRDGGRRPAPENSRSQPSMRSPLGPRFGEESGEGSQEGLFGLSRKRKEQRDRDHAEHQSLMQGSRDGNAGIHGGKHSEADFHGGPSLGSHDIGDHRAGSKISTSGHHGGRSHSRASNDEDDYRTEEQDDKASHKTRSTSISTFEALSLARQCLNLLHDMLVLLTTNRKE
uniref:Glycine rich superfamily member n=1 Tax=Rhipicephalus appendiculatus TaxID=34631 RepID=A0A131YZS8_RHIAP